MSYAVSAALQSAVYQHLQADLALDAVVGSAIYDAMPEGALPSLYVSLGPETAIDRSDVTGSGSLHRFTVSVVSAAAGFALAKQAAGAITDALDMPLPLTRGTLVYLNFDRAVARRTGPAGSLRQIDLRFRARVDDI